MADERLNNWDRLVLRLPKGMKQEVNEMAVDQCRALNGQLVHLIKRGMAAEAASAPTA